MFGSAFFSKELALVRLQHAFEHFSALRGFWIGDAGLGDWVALLRVPSGILVANAKGRLRDESEAAPFKVGAELEHLGHGLQSGAVAFPGNNALVLIFDFGLARLELSQQHDDGLQQIERLEAGSDYWLALGSCDPFIGPAA